MRKVLVLVCSATLVVGMAGIAGAIPITDTKYFGEWLSGTGSNSWQHETPHDFESPNNSVAVPATSGISGWLVSDDNIRIFLNGKAYGSLNKGSLLTSGVSWREFDIEDIFADWNAGDSFKFSPANKNMRGFRLTSSIFKFNFRNSSTPVVPEPVTLLLVGFALVGVSFFGRKKFLPKPH